MSKRVSNKSGNSRKTPARSRVSYGWRKAKLMMLKSMQAQAMEDKK